MKKVLYVSANGFIGGAEKFLINIARIHHETKDNVHFLLFRHGPLEDELKNLGLPVTVLSTQFKVRNIVQFFTAIKEIKKFLKKHNFSIVHSTMAYPHFVMGFATLFKRIKRVWFQHGPIGGMFDYLASIFFVDVLLFSSHFLMEKHYNTFLLRQARYGRKVIPLPVEMKPVKLIEALSLRKSLGLEGVYVIGMIGRLARGKGFELGIKSFLDLQMPETKLLIVGSANSEEDKKYENEIKNYVDRYNGTDKVVFVSHKSEVSVYYKIINLFLNPVTIDEGFGLAVAEAMASGIPVISSPYGGLSEFVRSNETAEVVLSKESDAVESIKAAIKKIREDEIYAKKLSKNAKDLIDSRFSFSQAYVAVTDVYQYLDSIE